MASDDAFGLQVVRFTRKVEKRLEEAIKESMTRTIMLSQGLIPHKTGFARASLRMSRSQMPRINPTFVGRKDQTYVWDSASALTAIQGYKIGGKLYAGWTAAYIQKLEYGWSRQAPSGFIRIAARQWQATVNQSLTVVKSRVP